MTQPALLAHPHLDKAVAFTRNGKSLGEPKFSANFVFPMGHPDLQPMKKIAIDTFLAKWPGRDFKTGAFPFLNGTAQADKAAARKPGNKFEDYARGKIIVASRSKFQPQLGVALNGKIIDLDTDELKALHIRKFYFGVQAAAQFNFVAYDGVGGKPDGVTAYLNLVISLNTGDRLAGASSASQVFSGFTGGVSNEDPTGEVGENEIPF
jgi:hypothetical protein